MNETIIVVTTERMSAEQAREVAENWQGNAIASYVDYSLEQIEERAKLGYFDTYVRVPSTNVNVDMCISAIKSLGYKYKSKNAMYIFWEW